MDQHSADYRVEHLWGSRRYWLYLETRVNLIKTRPGSL